MLAGSLHLSGRLRRAELTSAVMFWVLVPFVHCETAPDDDGGGGWIVLEGTLLGETKDPAIW